MIVAVVPALDEATRIAAVIHTMPRAIERVVVVDDGSTDATGRVAIETGDPRVEVVRHEQRRGVGRAIVSGCLRARSIGATIVVVLAGDGQMDPRDLDAVLSPLLEQRADFVKGNRLAWPEGPLAFPLQRLIGVVVLAALTRAATGLAIDDAQCGYVAFGPRALDALPWESLWPSFGYPNDLLSHMARLGLRVEEVPIRPVYGDEQSKLSVRHLPGIAWVVARAFARRAC